MTVFDQFFYFMFSFYKKRYKQNAYNIAIAYITILQIALMFLLGVFFAGFFKQLNMVTISSSKAWSLFVILAVFIHFKNWMQYTGKRRMMINAKMNKKTSSSHNIYLLWFLPIAILGLTYIFFQVA